MLKFLKKPSVPVIHINGMIDDKMTNSVHRQLKKTDASTAKCLAVVINSPGGSPVQSDIICLKLRNFSKKHNLPLYTFADDIAASGGYFILCSNLEKKLKIFLQVGDKVYADKTSLVGSIGAVFGLWNFKKLAEHYKMEVRKMSSQEMLLSHIADGYQELEQKYKDYLNKFSVDLHDMFINHVENHRKNFLKVPTEERKNSIYNADVFMGEKALEYGLVDQIGTYQSILYDQFPDAQLKFSTKKSLKEKLQGNQVKFNLNIEVDNQEQMALNVNKAVSRSMTQEYLKSFQ